MQAIILASKATALLDGRYNVSFDDVKAAAMPALRHRCILNFEAQAEGVDPDEIIEKIIATMKQEETKK
jgi:MoxR-like ATPase